MRAVTIMSTAGGLQNYRVDRVCMLVGLVNINATVSVSTDPAETIASVTAPTADSVNETLIGLLIGNSVPAISFPMSKDQILYMQFGGAGAFQLLFEDIPAEPQ